MGRPKGTKNNMRTPEEKEKILYKSYKTYNSTAINSKKAKLYFFLCNFFKSFCSQEFIFCVVSSILLGY